jgi:chromosome segregation ATPase
MTVEAQGAATAEVAAVNSLAHETLKKDASQLSAALLRSQKRAETLEKKMVALENDNLQSALERDRLVGNIEMLEETVAELRKERNEVTMQLTVSGAQWSRIIGNAAKLERGLWKEVKKRQSAERAELELEGVEGRCTQCAGSVNKLVDANRALKRRVEALEGAVERARYGGKEMGMLVQRLGLLNGQLEGELGRVIAGAASNSGGGGTGETPPRRSKFGHDTL